MRHLSRRKLVAILLFLVGIFGFLLVVKHFLVFIILSEFVREIASPAVIELRLIPLRLEVILYVFLKLAHHQEFLLPLLILIFVLILIVVSILHLPLQLLQFVLGCRDFLLHFLRSLLEIDHTHTIVLDQDLLSRNFLRKA